MFGLRLCLWNGDLGGLDAGNAILWRTGYTFSMVDVKYSDSWVANSVILGKGKCIQMIVLLSLFLIIQLMKRESLVYKLF